MKSLRDPYVQNEPEHDLFIVHRKKRSWTGSEIPPFPVPHASSCTAAQYGPILHSVQCRDHL